MTAIGKVRCVMELVAGNADLVEAPRRPRFFGVLMATLATCFLAAIGAAAALGLVSLIGIKVTVGVWAGPVPYLPTGIGPVVGDALVVAFPLSLMVLLTRLTLGERGDRPAWTWVAAALVPAGALAAISPGVSITGGVAMAGVAVRYTAWDAEGRARIEPLLTCRGERIVSLLLPAVLLAGVSAYALYHPLTIDRTSEPARIAPGTGPVLVSAPTITNHSSRPLRILSIEPGRERGYALHLIGVRQNVDGMAVDGRPPTRAVTSFVLAAGDMTNGLVLQLSRAGCRPGTSGRIETIRVSYVLGGVRTMELPLNPAPALSC